MRRTPALENTEERVEAVVSGGRLETKTAVFLGAEGVAGGFEEVEGAAEEDDALPFIAEVFDV